MKLQVSEINGAYSGCLLDDLLVSSLDTAVSLKQVEHVAMLVTKHLDFYVPEKREGRGKVLEGREKEREWREGEAKGRENDGRGRHRQEREKREEASSVRSQRKGGSVEEWKTAGIGRYLGLSTSFSISTFSSPKLFRASLLQESKACWKSAELRTIRIPWVDVQFKR